MAMTPELELLTALCIVPISRQSADRAQSLISRNPDWDQLIELAQSLNAVTTVLKNLTEVSFAGVPQDLRDRAVADLQTSRAAILGKILSGNHIVDQLDRLGIPNIVVKGAATGVSAYGDPTLRNFSDLDLIIAPSDVERASKVLEENGLEPQYEKKDERELLRLGHALEFMRPTLKVELHTELISKYLRVPFDNSEVWGTSRKVQAADREIRVLSIPIEFLYLSAHGTKHEWNNFRWITDIAHLLQRLSSDDREAIAEKAAAMHCLRLVALACQLAHDTFGIEAGPSLEPIRNSFDTSNLASEVLARIGLRPPITNRSRSGGRIHRAIPQQIFWCRARERLRDRILSTSDLLLRRRLGLA